MFICAYIKHFAYIYWYMYMLSILGVYVYIYMSRLIILRLLAAVAVRGCYHIVVAIFVWFS